MVLAQIGRSGTPDKPTAVTEKMHEQLAVVEALLDVGLMREIILLGGIAINLARRETFCFELLSDLVRGGLEVIIFVRDKHHVAAPRTGLWLGEIGDSLVDDGSDIGRFDYRKTSDRNGRMEVVGGESNERIVAGRLAFFRRKLPGRNQVARDQIFWLGAVSGGRNSIEVIGYQQFIVVRGPLRHARIVRIFMPDIETGITHQQHKTRFGRPVFDAVLHEVADRSRMIDAAVELIVDLADIDHRNLESARAMEFGKRLDRGDQTRMRDDQIIETRVGFAQIAGGHRLQSRWHEWQRIR